MTIVVGVILSLVAVVSAAVVIGGAVWAAKKDGEADRALRPEPEDPDRPPALSTSFWNVSSLDTNPMLIVDWDGTITERDSLLAVLEEFGDWEECRRLGDELMAGKITLREEIDAQFATVTAPLDDVVAWVIENVAVRPGLSELAALHPVVVSSGFHELIDPVLTREGIELELQANHVEARPDGWRPVWRELPICAVCGQPCKRSSFPPEGEVVYVGDGYSDRCGALAADRVFARRGLAVYLDEQGVSYEGFDDLHQIAASLS